MKHKINIVYAAIDTIKQYPGNTKKHPDSEIEKLAEMIEAYGFDQPIVVDKDMVIIKGHGRLLAHQKLGSELIPIVMRDDLSPALVKASRIADNKSNESEWDLDLLSIEFDDLKEMDFDLELTGFDLDEIDALMPEEIPPGLTDEDEVPEPPVRPVTKLGDVWLCGNHRVMCGDSTSIDAVEKLMDGNKADCVFSDPPYGIDVVQGKKSTVGGGGETKFTGTDGSSNFVEAKTYSKIIGDETTETAKSFYDACVGMGFNNIVLWGGNYFTDFLVPSRCWLIWDKEMTGNFSEAEMAWTSFSKGGIKVFKFLWNGLSRQGNRKDELISRVHPTQKPVGLFQNIFERFDGFKVIYDGFGGSGSTLIACEKTGRHARLMELDEKYCDVIVKRWQDFTGKLETLESTCELFNDLACQQ